MSADALLHEERWEHVGNRRLRLLIAGRRREITPEVVLLPGLGAVGYLIDTLHGCSGWTRATLLDLPGFGHRAPDTCAAEVAAIAEVTTAWLTQATQREPVVLFGHSTAAQAALHVAASAPEHVAAVIAAGPTFPPSLRALPAMAAAFLRNIRHEPPGALRAVLPQYVRANVRLKRLIDSARSDRPEEVVATVRCPLTVVRGRHDAFVPIEWARRLAELAGHGHVLTLPGAHTFPYNHGGATAGVIADAAARRSSR